MAVSRPDDALLASLGFPPPPHRLAPVRTRVQRAAGWLAVGLLVSVGLGILGLYFGVNREGRQLAVDMALALGLGRPIAEARVEPGTCAEYRTTGRYGTWGWTCTVVVAEGAARHALSIDTRHRPDLAAHDGAGRVLGAVGVYWHAGVLLDRWLSVALLLLLGGALAIGPLFLLAPFRRRARLAHGRVHTVDLLTWSGRKWFAFVDDRGVRRTGQAEFPGAALILDGVATTGVALVAGRHALLLDAQLWPLVLAPAQRAAILARAGEVRENGLRRTALQPVPGDAATLAGRIAALEAALAGPAPPLGALYDAAWRLVWDSTDAEVARRALVARDAIAHRMGPAAAAAALLAARARAAGLVVRR